MSTVLIEYIKCPNCGCPIEAFMYNENYVSVTYRGEEHGCKDVFFTVDKVTGETRPFDIERISIDKYMIFQNGVKKQMKTKEEKQHVTRTYGG